MRIFFAHVYVCIACVSWLPILGLTHLCPPMANLHKLKKYFYDLTDCQQKDCQVHWHFGINKWV